MYRTITGLVLVIAAIFAYLYYVNSDPFVDAPNRVKTPGAPGFSHFIYGGFGEDELNKPMAVTTIGEKVFVADTNNQRIQVFTKDGTAITKFGKDGTAKGEFQFPYGLTKDAKGRLLVADMYTGKISVFTPDGKFVEYYGEKQGIDEILDAPADIKFVNNKLYVADVDKHRVYVFDEQGKLLQELGKQFDELYAPNGVAVDKKSGKVFIVDTGNARVVVYDKNAKLLGKIDGTTATSKESVFVNPRGVDVAEDGTIYVVSNMTHLIYAFDQQGKEKFNFGGLGDGEGTFALPNGIFVDEDGNIFVTEQTNGRVSVFR